MRAFTDEAIVRLNAGRLSDADAAVAKLQSSEMWNRVAGRCLQLHGGYGYMNEYPIARNYTDARIATIYGGSNEIMKEIIARSVLG
jgi:alkylation response protein AidB-like acyl-CoA dehydrogenase